MLNEREELIAIAQRAASRLEPLSPEKIRAKIERGYLQSDRCEVDGELFTAQLLSKLDELERQRQAG